MVQQEAEGKSPYTLRNIDKFLTLISRNADLNNPKEVTLWISRHNVTNNTKEALCYAYRKYCKYHKIQAKIPFYKGNAKPVRIPTKEKIQTLISRASPTLRTKITLSMETGLRPIELQTLKVKDIDTDQNKIYPHTAKHGAPRPPLKISNQLRQMILEHINKHNLNQTDNLFTGTAPMYGKNFRSLRNKTATDLKDSTYKNISLYSLRHYFCTKKLYEIQNPYIVMNLMGHKRLETTQIYMHYLGTNEETEWICEGATTKDQAVKLIEAGFQYVTTIEGGQLFKKRK